MKLIKTASGKKIVRMSKKEWFNIGEKRGWTKKASGRYDRGEPSPMHNQIAAKIIAKIGGDTHGSLNEMLLTMGSGGSDKLLREKVPGFVNLSDGDQKLIKDAIMRLLLEAKKTKAMSLEDFSAQLDSTDIPYL